MAKQKKVRTRKALDLTDLDSKILVLQEKTKELIENRGMQTPTQKLLFSAKAIILDARKNRVSYTKIGELIYETFDYKISPQTIKKYIDGLEKEKV